MHSSDTASDVVSDVLKLPEPKQKAKLNSEQQELERMF